MQTQLDLLKHCLLLRTIESKDLKTYLEHSQMFISKFGKKEIIHFEGDLCAYLEVILEGNVVVERIDENGNLLTITDFQVNNSIGANLLYSSHPYFPLTVTAQVATTMLYVQKKLVFELCETNPEFLKLFLGIISDHTILLGNKIKHHVSRTIKEGIIVYIRQQYLLQNTLTLQLTCTKKALAEQMGISRTSLSRELQKMKDDALIDYTNKTLTIKNTRAILLPS